MWPFKNRYKEYAKTLENSMNFASDRIKRVVNENIALENKIKALQVRNQKLVEKLESVSAKLADTRKRNKTLVAAINRRGKKSGQ